jgi:hypothetical protein
MIVTRVRVALLTLVAALAASAAALGHVAARATSAQEKPSISQVILRDFVLQPSGLLFSLIRRRLALS